MTASLFSSTTTARVLAFLCVTALAFQVQAQDPLRFQNEVEQVREKYPPQVQRENLALFTGSSSIKMWNNLARSEEHTSELQSRPHLVCRLLLEKKNTYNTVMSSPKLPSPPLPFVYEPLAPETHHFTSCCIALARSFRPLPTSLTPDTL